MEAVCNREEVVSSVVDALTKRHLVGIGKSCLNGEGISAGGVTVRAD